MKYGNNPKQSNIPFKLNLISHLEPKYLLKVNKLNEDPLSKLVINDTELEIYRKLNSNNLYKNLYLNVKNITKILYDSNKNIEIERQCYNNQSLSQYFYLIMLINKDKYTINFSYSFDFIREMNNNNKSYNKQLGKIIRSKIILELIKNYKEFDTDEEIADKEIEMIQNENKSIIENNLTIFNDIGLNYNLIQIEEKEIDDLYVDIIYSIISNKSIEDYKDYKYILDLFEQMNLSQIDISKKIYEKLLNTSFFNSNHINQFSISSLKDLSDDKKIYFNYILINYILKDSIYIYQIPFLIKFRKFVLDNIKSKSRLRNLFEHIPKKRLAKISSIIEKLSDCPYYKKIFKDYKEQVFNSNKSNNININYFSIFKNMNNKINENIIYDNDYQLIISRSLNTTNSIYNNNSTNAININTNINNESNIENNNETNNNINNENTIENNNGNYNENNIENMHENFNGNNNENNNDIKSQELFILKTEIYHKINKTIETIDYNNETIKKSENDYNLWALFFKILFYIDNLILEEKDILLTNINCYGDIIFQNSNKIFFKINEDISVKTHNRFINGEDKLILYNSISKREIKTIKGYSFPLGINGFDIMHNKILICPCIKFVKGQKNGIFLLNFLNKDFPYYFENTQNFKVNCICSLYDKYNKKTDFFLAAGFNKKVIIKLYKLIYDYNYKSIKIKYIDDIIIRKNKYFTEFKNPIKYIKQFKLSGNIIFYSNKIIYVFSPPNLEKYLLFEEIEKNNNVYEKYIIEESTLYDNIT